MLPAYVNIQAQNFMSSWCTHTWSAIVANNSLRRTDKQTFRRTNLIYVYSICTAMCVRRNKKLSRIQFGIQTMYLVALHILVLSAYIYSIWPLGVQMYAWCTYMFVWLTVSCVWCFVQKINVKFALYVGIFNHLTYLRITMLSVARMWYILDLKCYQLTLAYKLKIS